MFAKLRDPRQHGWADYVDRVRRELGAPGNPALFPPHFLKATFPEIGGLVIECFDASATAAYGFLFPRAMRQGRRIYTLRYHQIAGRPTISIPHLQMLATGLLPDADVVVYDPIDELDMPGSVLVSGELEIGRPNLGEAKALRRLQAEIWGSDVDLLYPSDIHSTGFGTGTSLIGRYEGYLAGFLFGFVKFGGAPLPEPWRGTYRSDMRLESQVLGTDPAFRGRGIGARLKEAQAVAARHLGIDVVNWTVDPLQWPNAMLNIGTLGAVSYEFKRNWYPFQNELNQVPASRLGMTWLVNSERVVTEQRNERVLDLAGRSDIQRLNDGARLLSAPAEMAPGSPVAIEIPRDWTALQSLDYEQAWFWRETTDTLLEALLGAGEDRYMITAVGRDGARGYLVAEPSARVIERSSTRAAAHLTLTGD